MFKKIVSDKKMTFERFLSGRPARDYIFQKDAYEEQIRKAAEMIRQAEYVLIGAGAGLSTAAGAQYGGKFFRENFHEFQGKCGNGPYMQDMYSAGFYPYPSEEAYWGYWSKQAMKAGIEADYTKLHKVLLDMVSDKKVFVLSTNADGRFVKAGLSEDKIFCTQGDYFHIQCAKGCHKKIYDAVELFKQMDKAREDCMIPREMVPKCPVCGGRMNMNLRCDQFFVEDESWYQAENRFLDFLQETIEAANEGKKVVLLELGVGFNTPTIIRFPFEKMMRDYSSMQLIRLNLDEAVVPKSFGNRVAGINADMSESIYDIAKCLES